MGYLLGVDIGTTYTAGAVVASDHAEVVPLGNRSSVVPTVVYVGDDDRLLVGESAARRSLTDPGRVSREFKRRLGDTTPLLLGGSPYSPQSLMARVLRWVVERVEERQGEPPTHIAASHPANWGPYKLDLFEQAVRLADVAECTTVTEPEAAAAYYASHERMEPGEAVAVYDLGGGTFDAAVVRRTEVGFEILGAPEGIEHLGGIDIDEAVFAYLHDALDGALEELDADDPTTRAAIARLRQECVEAKEMLSTDVETSIPVLLPNVQTHIELTRSQLEAMTRPVLADTVGALRRALSSAGTAPDDISAVLLVGGSSRMPLVSELVGEELGRPVAVDAHPKHSVALGTVLAAEETVAREQGRAPVAIGVVEPRPTPQPAATPTDPPAADGPPPADEPATADSSAQADEASDETVRVFAPPADDEEGGAEDHGSDGDGRGRTILLSAAASGIVVVGLAALLWGWFAGDDDPEVAEPAADGEEEQAADETDEDVSSETTDDDEGDDGPAPYDDLPDGAACDGDRCVGIEELWVDDDADLVVEWVSAGFEPYIAEDHAHFFWDIYDPDQVGTNAAEYGAEQAPWEITDESPFVPDGEVALANIPDGAEGLCVTVGDADHAVIEPGNHHCVDLPDEVAFVARCDDTYCIEIDDVWVDGGELAIEWTPDGFEPDVANEHAHFFWDVYEPDQVGSNAADFDAEQAPWELTDQIPFVPGGELQLANLPDDAEAVCVTVADGNHGVLDPANYHCVPLPDDA